MKREAPSADERKNSEDVEAKSVPNKSSTQRSTHTLKTLARTACNAQPTRSHERTLLRAPKGAATIYNARPAWAMDCHETTEKGRSASRNGSMRTALEKSSFLIRNSVRPASEHIRRTHATKESRPW